MFYLLENGLRVYTVVLFTMIELLMKFALAGGMFSATILTGGLTFMACQDIYYDVKFWHKYRDNKITSGNDSAKSVEDS